MGDNPLMIVEFDAKIVTVTSGMFPALKDVKLPRDNDRTGVGAGTAKAIDGNNYILILRPNIKITLIVENERTGNINQYKGECRTV